MVGTPIFHRLCLASTLASCIALSPFFAAAGETAATPLANESPVAEVTELQGAVQTSAFDPIAPKLQEVLAESKFSEATAPTTAPTATGKLRLEHAKATTAADLGDIPDGPTKRADAITSKRSSGSETM